MNSKTYRIGFFALLLINIVLVLVFTLRPKPHGQPNGTRDEVSSKLGFSEEQKAKFAVMVQDHRDKMGELRKEEQELIKKYFNYLSSQDQSDQQEELAEEIKVVQGKKLKVTYDHFQQVRTICEEHQLAGFEQLMDKMLRVLIGEKGPPGR